MAATRGPSWLPLAALLVGAACIAASPIWVRLSETGPTATAFWRVALSLPLLALIASVLRRNPAATPLRGTWGTLLVAGISFAGDLAFWHASIGLTSVANATLFANLAAPLVTLALWFFWRERPSGLFLLALSIALLGVVTLLNVDFTLSPGRLAGDALGLATAFFYASYLLAVARMRERGIGVVSLMLVSSTITALVLGPLALLADAAWMPSTGQGWAILVGLAWISHTAGQGLIAYAFAHLRPAFSALVLLLQPVLAALFAWEILGEAMQPGQLVGAGFVILGIALAQRAAPTRR